MTESWHQAVLRSTGAKSVHEYTVIQSLWSGYGEIIRAKLTGAKVAACIVKHIKPPTDSDHPRGWNSPLGHRRKLRSYEVEINWYRDWSRRCDENCRVPHCYTSGNDAGEQILVLEDIDASRFPARPVRLDSEEARPCLRWLAYFHARFMNETPTGLWPTGTYWHLATRPEEFAAMRDGAIKRAAKQLDYRLNHCRFQSIVHGDAKLANFCFSKDGNHVAAVDFQYVGAGCGIKDVAYFLGSCLTEDACRRYEKSLLDDYFSELKNALAFYQKPLDTEALEAEWRQLYCVAWTDFYRFLLGWMPSHKKINRYTRKLAGEALQQLAGDS